MCMCVCLCIVLARPDFPAKWFDQSMSYRVGRETEVGDVDRVLVSRRWEIKRYEER